MPGLSSFGCLEGRAGPKREWGLAMKAGAARRFLGSNLGCVGLLYRKPPIGLGIASCVSRREINGSHRANFGAGWWSYIHRWIRVPFPSSVFIFA
jgi:hypothetical protein